MNSKPGIGKIAALVLIFVILTAAGVQPAPAFVWAQQVDPPETDGAPTLQAPRIQPKADELTGFTPGQSVNAPDVTTTSYPSAPAYDSGWQMINAGQTLTLDHNLGGDINDYVVDLRFDSQSSTMESHGFNQVAYGGNQLMDPVPSGYGVDDMVGAYWHSLTTAHIKVFRMSQDKVYAVKIRMRIWAVTAADWDSGWFATSSGTTIAKAFTIPGGLADNYLVYMEFKDTSSPINFYGIHQRYYGGFSLANTNAQVGAYWRNLTAASITVHVRPDESSIDQVRLRIWNQPKATYDSGWINGNPGSYNYLTHSIGGNPDDYIVDLQQDDTSTWGVNQRCYGGCDLRANDGSYVNTKQGAYWRNLTNQKIELGRRVDDVFAAKVRVRIWNIWTPARPDYTSGWKTSTTGIPTALTHGLGGDANDYMVSLAYYDSTYLVNQLYYGVKTFGDNPPADYFADYEGGTYWRSLTNSSVVIYRAPQDTTCEKWLLNIWKMPTPDYDSGWTAITAGSLHTFEHGLLGAPSDFLVDVSFYDPDSGSGINQRFLGGMVTTADNYLGAIWHSFTTTSGSSQLKVYRFPDDYSADQTRVRIWRVNTPKYQSGYLTYSSGEAKFLSHNLNVSPDRMFVDVTAHQPTGDHKDFYGRLDIGKGTPVGIYSENDRVGYEWYYLTTSEIGVYRLPQDNTAQTINVRIWVMPTSTFIPYIKK